MKHPLTIWLEKSGETKAAFAKRAGLSKMHLWRLMNGKGEFSTSVLRSVSEATDGEVTIAELASALGAAA